MNTTKVSAKTFAEEKVNEKVLVKIVANTTLFIPAIVVGYNDVTDTIISIPLSLMDKVKWGLTLRLPSSLFLVEVAEDEKVIYSTPDETLLTL